MTKKKTSPLFTENFLSHYLLDFKLSNTSNIRRATDTLKRLNLELKSEKINNAKEEEFKSRFLNEFFGDVLGFNYGNSNFWTLREEVKTKVDGTKADGALGFFTKNKENDDVRAVIEIKDAKTNLEEKQNRTDPKPPINQAFEYASKMGNKCDWIIVSNFKEIRFYYKSQDKFQIFFLDELTQEEKLKELIFLFHKDRFIKEESLSSTENLLHTSFLNFLENEKPRHIVDEIYTSLKRFEGLNYIDPNYLASLKPFNILNEYVWHYRNGNLLTINPSIYSLFKELKFENDSLIISEKLKKELQDSNVIEYQTKIEYFIKFLNHSNIDEITCIRDYNSIVKRKSNTIGFSIKHHFHFSERDGFTKKINLLKNKVCDCFSCNYKSLKFNHLLSKIKTQKYKDESISLEYAYANYLVSSNNYKEAYNLYKRISESSKSIEGREIEYFLSKLNMKSLLNLVWEDEQLQDSFEIKAEIRNIDLNKILYSEIEYSIGDDVRNYLLKIKNNELFISAKNKIHEYVEKIIEARKHNENPNNSDITNNYIQRLGSEYYKLQLHLNKNRIIYNCFHDYRLLTAKVFEGCIESYLTKRGGLKEFNSFYLKEFILNIPTSNFKKILSKVESITINKDDTPILIGDLRNLFNSYLSNFSFGFSCFKNKVTEEFLIDSQFKDNYCNLISNSFTLLYKLDIHKGFLDDLFKSIIDFLSIEDELSWNHIQEFENVLYAKGDHFTNDQLIKILEIAIERDKPNYNKYENLIKTTCICINKFYPDEKLINKRLIKKSISNISSTSKWINISYLLLITDTKGSDYINNEIEEFLDEEFDPQFYNHLIRRKLYDSSKKNYFKKFIEHINKNRGGYEGESIDNKAIFSNYTFFNFIILLNILEIERDSDFINSFPNIKDYEHWLLNPKEFNYNDFNINWVLAFDHHYILKNLNKIEGLKKVVSKELEKQYNQRLSEIYYKYII